MSKLEITLSLILSVSIIINVGMLVYLRAVLARLLSVSEEIGDLQDMTNSFATHLKKVYELETFYGDQTLSYLLEHAISFNEQLETFEYIYSLTETETEIEEEQEEFNFDETEIDSGRGSTEESPSSAPHDGK
jgi:hypothetical protein|tara:strand:+ start:39 stop:437 length:399 start_codon:yes stop_codon:yes gene_type:complete